MSSDWEYEDHEGPSEADLERFGGETKRCPECGAEVYDQAAACHRCGYAFEGETATGNACDPRRPKIATAAIVVLLILGLFSLFVLRIF
ncbi:MAG: hypothetical protein AAFR38_11240 [Planctomycetota bacterium]